MKLIYNKKCKLIIQLIIIILPNLFVFIINVYNPYKLKNEYIKIENYLKTCSNPNIIDFNISKISNQPKISIITPLYNTGRFVSRLLRSIQLQNFKDVEIILIDDCSIDNSLQLIKNSLEKDKRIKLIKNKKNKGTFSSRNIGILKSKGTYIILPDSDDIILENIFIFFGYKA